MRRVDNRQPLNPRITPNRRRPGGRPTPVVPNQREPLDAEGVGQREHIGDGPVGAIGGHFLRLIRRTEPALIGHDQPKAVGQQWRHAAPGAVRFGEAVEQDDRRRLRRTGERDIERNAGRQRNPLKSSLPLGKGRVRALDVGGFHRPLILTLRRSSLPPGRVQG